MYRIADGFGLALGGLCTGVDVVDCSLRDDATSLAVLLSAARSGVITGAVDADGCPYRDAFSGAVTREAGVI